MGLLVKSWQSWLWTGGIIGGAIILALIFHSILVSLAQKFANRTSSVFDDSIVRHGKKPAKLIFPLVGLLFALPMLHLSVSAEEITRHLLALGVIAASAWLLIAMMDVVEDMAAAKFRVDVQDNLKARKIQTQVQVVRRIVVVVVLIVSVSAGLMTFPTIRQIGTSLLASAGLAGLIIGFAARPALSNLIAGMQIALSEPIRLDDVVIVEGEWGWIEEIGTTYVVVRIWDLRRLILPLSYFIEKPFQNWTRKTADLLGTVFVYTDYSVPTEEVRQELHRILQATPLWDGKAWGLQVTNASEHTMELRALMSASDSSKAWDLRCLVREKLIAYLQEKHPQCLPRVRAEIQNVCAI
jgi:small-conductance mechanosensitive channel